MLTVRKFEEGRWEITRSLRRLHPRVTKAAVCLVALMGTFNVYAEDVDQSSGRYPHFAEALHAKRVAKLVEIVRAFDGDVQNERARYSGKWYVIMARVDSVGSGRDGTTLLNLEDLKFPLTKSQASLYETQYHTKGADRAAIPNPTESDIKYLSKGDEVVLNCFINDSNVGKPVLSSCLYWDWQTYQAMYYHKAHEPVTPLVKP